MKRNRTQLFCGSLYVESLRQLRLMGLIYLACCLIFTMLPTLLSSLTPSLQLPSVLDFAPVLFLFVLVAPLTLTYSAFGYLTRRNASDFYHALPMTRECAYVTRSLAVATYLVGTIVLSLLSAYFIYVLCGQSVNWGYLPYQIFYFTSCALLIGACSLVGLSVTGTFFSAFIVTGLVLFLPRFISFMTALMIEEVAPIVSSSELGMLLNLELNLPASWFATLFTGGMLMSSFDLESSMLSAGPALYTGVLALIYYVLGGFAHHYRKSETALKSAPNRALQHVYRCAISLPLFLVVGMMVVMGWSSLWDEPLMTWLLIATALLVYFIYELITTKKLRNLLPALAVLPIVVVVGIGIPFAGKMIGKSVMHVVPEKERIVSVNLDVNQFSGTSDYTALMRSRIDFADEELNDLLLRGLGSTINLFDSGASRAGYHSTSVRFNLTGGRAMTRRIYFTPDDYARLCGIRDGYAVYQNALIKLPDDSEITSIRCVDESSRAENWLLWQTFRQEYEALDDKDKISINNRLSYDYTVVQSGVGVETSAYTQPADAVLGDGRFTAESLEVSGSSGVNNFTASYAITPLTPKTLLLVMERSNQRHQNALTTIAESRQVILDTVNTEIWAYNEFSLYDPSGAASGQRSFSLSYVPGTAEADRAGEKTVSVSTMSEYAALLDLLASASTQISDLNSPIVAVEYLNVDVYDTGYSAYISPLYLRLTQDQFDEFTRLMEAFQAA